MHVFRLNVRHNLSRNYETFIKAMTIVGIIIQPVCLYFVLLYVVPCIDCISKYHRVQSRKPLIRLEDMGVNRCDGTSLITRFYANLRAHPFIACEKPAFDSRILQYFNGNTECEYMNSVFQTCSGRSWLTQILVSPSPLTRNIIGRQCCTFPFSKYIRSKFNRYVIINAGEAFQGGLQRDLVFGTYHFEFVSSVLELNTNLFGTRYVLKVIRIPFSAQKPIKGIGPVLQSAALEPHCFPADSTVMTRSGSKRMKLLRRGDSILTYNNMGLKWDTVSYFIHRRPDEADVDFHIIHTEKGRISATGDHLIYALLSQNVDSPVIEPILTRDLKIGDLLIEFRDFDISPIAIVNISRVKERGIYAPFVGSGNIIVDGFLCSCYATIVNIQVLHTLFTAVNYLESFLTDVFGCTLLNTDFAIKSYIFNLLKELGLKFYLN